MTSPRPASPGTVEKTATRQRGIIRPRLLAVLIALAAFALTTLGVGMFTAPAAATGLGSGTVCPQIGEVKTTYYGEKFLCVQAEDSQPRWQQLETCPKCWTCPVKCSPKPSPSASSTVTPSPTVSPSASPSASVSPSPSMTPAPEPSDTPTQTASPAPSPSEVTPGPSDDLPLTGPPTGAIALIGAGSLGLGAAALGLLYLMRRRTVLAG